jgi:ParB-like chromosome segregation protein Spo0J
MRYRAAKELKYKEVPVIVMGGLTVEDEREITIRDNGAWGEFDFSILANDWSNEPLVEWGVKVPEDWIESQNEGGGQEQEAEKKPITCPECGHTWTK